MSHDDAFGFTWPSLTGGSSIEVERTARLPNGTRVLTVKTHRQTVELYVTRTGLVRVFSGKATERKRVELKKP